LGLSAIFLYLSIDEGAAIHEFVGSVLETALQPTGYLYFAWLIAALPLLLVFALLYWRFLMRLPARFRRLFVAAAVSYIGGALVIESISANRWYLDGGPSFTYLAIATVEEGGEILGAIVLIYALLRYLAEEVFSLALPAQQAVAEGPRRVSRPRLVLGAAVIGFVLVFNTGFVSWAMTQSALPEPGSSSPVSKRAMMDQFVAQGMIVTQLTGQFDSDNLAARRQVESLLRQFGDVLVLTWDSSDSSIALARSERPVRRDEVIELLRAGDQSQFILYDTAAVVMMVDNPQ
jgi:hypothetical protein